MIFETHDLKPELADLVESIFHFKGFNPDHTIERVVPTGHLFIIFELDGIERNTFDNESLKPIQAFREAWVSGMHRNYISISAHDDSEMFVIQFKAGGAYPFLHFHLDSITEKVVPASDLLDGSLINLRKQLLQEETSQNKFAVAERWLEKRYREDFLPSESLMHIVRLLRDNPASKLADIVDSFSGTQKHLIDRFKKFVGLTPKTYQRILRFNDILVQMNAEVPISWAEIADRCGYSDQSHFIREFKHFSGFNPQEFIRQDFGHDESNFFPLDREG